MQRIASFSVNHDRLTPGMYLSRADGDVLTYDLRFKTPNAGDYLGDGVLHTIEHLFATHARNGPAAPHIVYIGPMGCRTGFYLLTRDVLPPADAIALTRDAMRFIADFQGHIPGARRAECGNYRAHDLPAARREAAAYAAVLAAWTPARLTYPEGGGGV